MGVQSTAVTGLPGNTVAYGSPIVVTGSGLSSSTGTKLLVNGVVVPSSVVSDQQINAYLPVFTPPDYNGIAQLKVSNGNGQHAINLMVAPAGVAPVISLSTSQLQFAYTIEIHHRLWYYQHCVGKLLSVHEICGPLALIFVLTTLTLVVNGESARDLPNLYRHYPHNGCRSRSPASDHRHVYRKRSAPLSFAGTLFRQRCYQRSGGIVDSCRTQWHADYGLAFRSGQTTGSCTGPGGS